MYVTYDDTKYLFYTSFLFFICSLLFFLYDFLLSSIIIFILFLSSINHWRNPQYNFHRTIDMIIVIIIGNFYIINSFYKNEFCRVLYINLAISIVIFYILEFVLDFYKNNQWIIFHMAIHIYGTCIFILFLFI